LKKYIEPPDHKNFRKKPTADFLKFQLPHAWNFIHLFLFPAILDLCTRGAPSPAHAGSGRRGMQKMAELAEGDGGKELRVLSGAVYDAGWGI